MRYFTMLLFIALALSSCTKRTSLMAPRLEQSEDHLSAAATDCVGCHDAAALPRHEPGELCTRCHRLSPR
jgi:hypothetical protein